MQGMEGRKDDSEKDKWNLLQTKSIRGLVKVLSYGARKYAPENWRLVKDGRERYYAAAMRHIHAWRDGEERDEETGLNHLWHAMCCLMFLDNLGDPEICGYTQHSNQVPDMVLTCGLISGHTCFHAELKGPGTRLKPYTFGLQGNSNRLEDIKKWMP